jgi:hypothetical protein
MDLDNSLLDFKSFIAITGNGAALLRKNLIFSPAFN